MDQQQTDDELYRVVVNPHGQYSIWAVGRALPTGWSAEGSSATREQCLDRIESIWSAIAPDPSPNA